VLDRFAALADIHGNIWALKAVLEDIRAREITAIVNLGDHVHGPLEPAATADLLMRSEMRCISGNQDRVIPETTLAALRPHHLEWLSSLPTTHAYDDVLLCHGTPASDETYFLETVTQQGPRLATQSEIAERLGNVRAGLVLCGHTHVPRLVHASASVLIVNPGSAGLPAYDDDLPFPHRMETGSPFARYAVLSRTPSAWKAELIAIPYDWGAAAECARRNGREDWARRLQTGRA
jgi:putative phosphoesterase